MPSGSRRRRGGPRSSTTGHNPQASVENRQGLNWEIWAVGTFSVLLLGFPAKGKRVISLKDTVRLLFLNRFSIVWAFFSGTSDIETLAKELEA